jgi:hypothetical protein
MSELSVGSLKGLAANDFKIEVASGSKIVQPGSILQVVSTTKTDAFSTSSASLTDITGLSVTITPSSSSSKIFIIISLVTGHTIIDRQYYMDIARNGTAVSVSTAGSSSNAMSGDRNPTNLDAFPASFQFLDSPASTSPLTYSGRIGSNGDTVFVNRRGADANFGFVSTITAMEVAG